MAPRQAATAPRALWLAGCGHDDCGSASGCESPSGDDDEVVGLGCCCGCCDGCWGWSWVNWASCDDLVCHFHDCGSLSCCGTSLNGSRGSTEDGRLLHLHHFQLRMASAPLATERDGCAERLLPLVSAALCRAQVRLLTGLPHEHEGDRSPEELAGRVTLLPAAPRSALHTEERKHVRLRKMRLRGEAALARSRRCLLQALQGQRAEAAAENAACDLSRCPREEGGSLFRKLKHGSQCEADDLAQPALDAARKAAAAAEHTAACVASKRC